MSTQPTTILVYGPAGCGKTRNATRIAQALGLTEIVDNFVLGRGVNYPKYGALLLTQTPPPDWWRLPAMEYADAMKRVEACGIIPAPVAWLAAALLSLVLGASHLLDNTPSDTQAARDIELSLADATLAAQQQTRFEQAAQRVCAGHGSAAMVADHQIICTGPNGQNTFTAQVAL